MKNTRKNQRVPTALSINFAANLGDDWMTGATRNISLGGAFIEHGVRPAFGSRVALRFEVSTQDEPIEVEGFVRWTDDAGFGVQFDGLRARDTWALAKHLETA